MTSSLANQSRRSLLSRLLGNTFIRICLAGIGGILVTLLLFITMKSLITNYDDSATNAAYRLFTLNTIVLQNGPNRPARVDRPAGIDELPVIPLGNTEDIKQQSEAYLSNQSIAKEIIPQPEALQDFLQKKNELIAIPEPGP